ncbi:MULTISPECIES: arginine--tRNA ligase [unclassified Bradyrhizobium]|uniref:arginine--tRNA ligase n=1 Tax=unclassified Bradyrhizobium TaxID=2631580 RepID=UPI0028F088F6|nr:MULTISPECIES: arginine--tRNA ligase [unclassified Bradyrhizobium]
MTQKHQHLFITIGSSVASANAALVDVGFLPKNVDQSKVVVEPTKDPAHGDIATNSAIVLAKQAGKSPRELAGRFADELLRIDSRIEKVDVAGPGFVNLTLKSFVWTDELRKILREGVNYGRIAPVPGAPKVNVEYVSANPTGPMHVGHCRGAVFGDALCSLLEFAGRDVTREYYINDAGAQVDVLARSAFLRYREALGEEIGTIPDGLYPGDYLKPVGKALADDYGDKLTRIQDTDWLPIVRQAALEEMLVQILEDLKKLNITFDVFFSEKALLEGAVKFTAPDGRPTFYFAKEAYSLSPKGHRGIRAYLAQQKLKETGPLTSETRTATFGASSMPASLGQPDYIGQTLKDLKDRGLIYEGRLPPPKGALPDDWEDRNQTLFRATSYGDDVDRPLVKSDGSYTYFASDIANHRNKYERGFTDLIDVFGADHGGYIKRMQAAVKAVTAGQAVLDVKVVQLVKLLRNGEPVKMSKRSGDFVTLREVVDEVGRDAVRFMMLYRKNDAVLDFDLAKVIEQSRDNPVFYVQYGHARGHSIFRNARESLQDLPEDEGARLAFLREANLEKLSDSAEHDLLKRLALYPRTVESAALAHEPHRIAFYLYELASEFHALWTRGRDLPYLRFIIDDDAELTKARLAMVQGVVSVLASGLAILGVNAPDAMR